MQIKSLSGLPVAVIAETFNHAFSDYLVPISLTEQALLEKMRSENTNLELSAGAFHNGRLVGFILIGVGEGVAYNGGTGVIPEYRGQKLTQEMYAYLLPLLADAGIDRHQLEVITENTRAVQIYQNIGFETLRKVWCFKGNVAGKADGLPTIRKMNLEDLNPNFADFNPTFQNSTDAILRTGEQFISLGAFLNNELVGQIVFSPETARIKHFAVSKSHRNKGIGKGLFHQVQISVGGKMLSLINVDENDAAMDFLQAIGMQKTVSQLEMAMNFKRY